MAARTAPSPLRNLLQALPFLIPPLLVGTLFHCGGTPVFGGESPTRMPVIGTLRASRDEVPRIRTTAMLDQRLRELARKGALRGMPERFELELTVDASGAIRHAAAQPAAGEAAQPFLGQLLGWRFSLWTVSGETLLSVPVAMVNESL